MLKTLIYSLMMLYLVIGHTYSQDNKEAQNSLAEQVNRLIEDLGSDDFKTREKATEALKQIGAPALPALEKAARDSDEERASRSKKLIEAIQEPKSDRTKPYSENLPKRYELIPGQRQAFSFSIRKDGGVTIRHNSDGSVVVTEKKKDENGEEMTNEYRAESIEEFKKKYPDIAKKYGIGEQPKLGFEFKFNTPKGLDRPLVPKFTKRFNPFDFNNFDKEFKDLLRERFKEFEDMDKYIENLRRHMGKEFEDLGHNEKKDLEGHTPDAPPATRPEKPSSFGVEIRPADATLQEQLNLGDGEGVVVTRIDGDSIAEKAGLKKHDVILSINNHAVGNVWEFRSQIQDALSGGILTLEIYRAGEKKTLTWPERKKY